MAYEVGQTLDLNIERLSFNGGRGVARHEGFVFFVPFVLPGESIKAKITKIKKRYGEAELIEVVKPSPERQVGPCILFGECGGCTWQHIPYEKQLVYKKDLLLDMFSGLINDDKILDPTPSPRAFYYRNRIQLHRDQNNQWGFKKRGTDHVLPIESCPITDARINLEIPKLTRIVPANEKRIEIYVDPSNQVNRRFGKHTKFEGQFSQVNSEVNKILNEAVYEIVDRNRPRRLYDLYCGQGNFILYLADTFTQCEFIGVELSKKNLDFAIEGAEGSPNAQFLQADVAQYLRDSAQFQPDDLIILDPPRSGLTPEALSALIEANPHQVIYISCDPMTLKRDLAALLENGLKVETLRPIDMFPQTDHIETITYLIRQ
ncbi:MAG: hypothetical protein CL677_00025 [Bdellovibrionaceae bacterium]|nr:hypothetical protein [Pseudobdellovibrionaceae bacterium]|tara:strand:- start:36703 stop:37827 length:1125 start_codon:yes stop_codon:yes gene_type:complete